MPTRSPHAEDDPESDIELDEDTASDPHPRHVSNYLAHLHEHAQSVRQHVTGAPTDYYLTSQPSYFAPNAYWTAQEKDAFFHALSVHSRLRPDLIAEEIGTKSLADVCAYMDMLEDGMKRNPSSSNDDATADARGLVFASRDDFPIAYEVSEKWTDFEDELAEALMADEPDMIAEGLQRARDDLIREERLGIRARKGDARLADNTRDREGEKMRKQRFQQWLQGQEAEWQKEDLLNRMDGSLMKAMDMVIREHEEARALLPEVDAKPYEPEDQHMSPEVPSGDVPAGHALTTDTIPPLDEEFIDPSLRSSAAPTAVHSPESSNSRTGRPHTPEPTNPHDTFNPVTPPFADVHKAASSSTLFEPHADTASVADSNAAAGAELERPLSPASRRRLRKRMYMRRKRAEATGGDVDQSLGRLKPGRKPLPRPGEVEDDTVPTRHAHPSGKTLTYKMKEQLKVAEITPEWLEEEHLDLFHMSGLYKLMRCARSFRCAIRRLIWLRCRTYNQLHDVPDDVLSEISIQTLRTLRNEVVRFIFRVVQRAIISREQEMISKIHTKVWRLGDNQESSRFHPATQRRGSTSSRSSTPPMSRTPSPSSAKKTARRRPTSRTSSRAYISPKTISATRRMGRRPRPVPRARPRGASRRPRPRRVLRARTRRAKTRLPQLRIRSCSPRRSTASSSRRSCGSPAPLRARTRSSRCSRTSRGPRVSTHPTHPTRPATRRMRSGRSGKSARQRRW